mgnify:CR=1 FL=1
MFERKERKKLEFSSQILGWGSATVACIIGLRLLGVLTLNTEVMTNAIMLLMLGGVLLAEFYKERKYKVELERSVSTGDWITIVLASAAILLGAVELMGVWITLPTFPLPVYGAIGLLYIILAAVMIVKIYA